MLRQPLHIRLMQPAGRRQRRRRRPLRRVIFLDQLENLVLDFQLSRVGQLVAIVREHLDAVVRPGIVRGRDHHAGGELTHARQVRHARRGQHAGRFHCHPSFFQSCGHGGRDPSAGLARVFSHHHPRASMRARQIMPQRLPDDPRGSFIQRKASRHAADAIGAKQRALPGFHFCGDRQDAINGGGFLILPRIAPKPEVSCGTAALGCAVQQNTTINL